MRTRAPLLLLIAASSIASVGCHRHRKPKNPQPGAPADQPAATAQPAGPAVLAAMGSASGCPRVTNDNVAEAEPQLSPDGKVLIFVAWQQVADANGNAVTQTAVLGADPANGSARTIYTNANAGANWPA